MKISLRKIRNERRMTRIRNKVISYLFDLAWDEHLKIKAK